MPTDNPRAEHDTELCRRAQSGDVSAANLLISEYLPFVRHMVYRFRCPGIEADDLLQEGLIGLFNAVLAYDATRGAAFSSFAYRCVLNRLRSVISASSDGSLTDEKLSALLAKMPVPQDPQEILQSREDVSGWMERASQCLSKLERNVLRMHLGGASYREMAERLGVAEKSVDNAMQRIRRKLRRPT